MWFVYALGSAVFAALTSILAKIGIEGVNSTLATAIRTAVVLLMSWAWCSLPVRRPVLRTSPAAAGCFWCCRPCHRRKLAVLLPRIAGGCSVQGSAH